MRPNRRGADIVQPYQECPQYDTCSVNNCPLHPDYPNLPTCPQDPEKVCKTRRSSREAIAARYPGVLRFNGLLRKDIRRDMARERWNALPAEEKARRIAKLKERTGKYRHGAPQTPGAGAVDGESEDGKL